MAVTKRTRFEVLKRDNHTCRYCHATDSPLTVDHVTPQALGGSDDPSNLVAACRDCNSGKASTSPSDALVADVSQRTVEWAGAIAAFNSAQMSDRRKRDAYVRKFEKAWAGWSYGPAGHKVGLPLPTDWKATVWQFYGLGLPVGELEDAVYIAASNQVLTIDKIFRYMCGILWNKVNAMHEGAKVLLGAGV